MKSVILEVILSGSLVLAGASLLLIEAWGLVKIWKTIRKHDERE
jgi:hypothetical protein